MAARPGIKVHSPREGCGLGHVVGHGLLTPHASDDCYAPVSPTSMATRRPGRPRATAKCPRCIMANYLKLVMVAILLVLVYFAVGPALGTGHVHGRAAVSAQNQLKFSPSADNRLKSNPSTDNQIKSNPSADNQLKFNPSAENQLKFNPSADNQLKFNPRYEPNWESIDSRPLPDWYDEAKLGIFIHWGVFSVPSIISEWFWWYWEGDHSQEAMDFMKKNYPPDFTYGDFAPQFRAEFFDPNQWADIFKASGAKYVVLTSKHHEGFCNWNTSFSFNWNSVEVGPKLDLVGDLANAIRNRTDIHFGLYHSLFEWFHPLYLEDKANNFQTNRFVMSKALPELYEIVNKYKPDIVWSDGEWEAPHWYWNATIFLAWLYNDSPVKDTVVTNDRWGSKTKCHHGGYYTCHDKYNPGHLVSHKWENAMTIDSGSWGFRRTAKLSDYLTVETLLTTFIETVSCGGNMLMNVGPTHDGRILPIFEERLRQMGEWLGVNGEAIYSSRPWTKAQNDTITPKVWYTTKKDATAGGLSVYANVLEWPKPGTFTLGAPNPSASTTVTLLGYSGSFKYMKHSGGGIDIQIPAIPANEMPCKWAWVFKFTNLE